MDPSSGKAVEPPDNGSDPSRPPAPEPDPQGGNFIHGLIGFSPGGFSETVRNSFSSLTRRDHEGPATSTPPQPGVAAPIPRDDTPPEPPSPSEPRPRHFLTLPHEIILMILQRLDFADIVRLRLTCRQFRYLATPQQIRTLFGADQLRMQILGHCKSCLVYDPLRSSLMQPIEGEDAAGYPFVNLCIDCALKARDPRLAVGQKILLANFDMVWVCRWCGYPVVEGAAFGYSEMHRVCYKRYNDVLVGFFVLGWIQLGLGIVASALAWRYYRGDVLVFAPTVTNFILLWICLAFLVWRGKELATYHKTLVLELMILCIWIAPVYHVASQVASSGDPVAKSTRATLAMFALNMLFRLLNLMGNVVLFLWCVDTTKRHRRELPKWKLPCHYLATALIMWTYPQSVEQEFPLGYCCHHV